MDALKATHVAVRLGKADVGPLVAAVAFRLSEPFTADHNGTAASSPRSVVREQS